MTNGPVVAHIFNRLDPGGAELRTIDLAVRLKPQVSTIFVVTSKTPGALEDRVRSHGFEVVQIALGPGFFGGLRRLVRSRHVTTLHSHASTTSGLFCALGAACRVPQRIAHFRSDSDGKPDTVGRRLKRFSMRLLIRGFATDVVGVSPMALRYAGDWAMRSSRGQVIPSGIEVEPPTARETLTRLREDFTVAEDDLMIVHVGRDLPEKNRPRAVAITGAARARGLDVCLVLVGRLGAGEENDLLDLATGLGVGDHVRIVGQRHDIQRVLAAGDVCLVTSTREGLPGVVLESVAAGRPCVASDLPGVRWIADTFSGVLPLGLGESDERWVDLLQVSAAQSRSVDRDEDLHRLEESRFSLTSAVEAYRRLWGGAA